MNISLMSNENSIEIYENETLIAAINKILFNEIKRYFNIRLKEKKLKPLQIKLGKEENIDKFLGRELCVLAWAIELANTQEHKEVLKKWFSLRPEERWWLFHKAKQSQYSYKMKKAIYLLLS